MAIAYSYPTGTPELQDLLVGTEIAEQGGEVTPRTRTFTIGSIVDLANGGVVGSEGPQGPTGAQGIQGVAGTTGAVGPAGLEWRGPWSPTTSYIEDDAVGWGGASWFCILATIGTQVPSLDATHWALLASQGAIGPIGAQGPTGPQGLSGGAGTLQQTVDNGNEVTDGFGNTTNIYSGAIQTADILGSVTIGSDVDLQKGIYTAKIYNPGNHTASRTYTLPNASGTVALTSDLSLQQAFNNGKTMTTGNFTAAVFDLAPGLSIKNTSSLSEIAVETGKITFTKNQGGLKTTNLFQAVTPTVNRAVYLPDADGTIALLPTVAGNYANDAAAAAAGIAIGSLYHTAGVVKVRLT